MNIDLGSFAFGATLKSGGGTCSWGTSLGQSKPAYKYTYPGFESIVIGMMYCSAPKSFFSMPLGKGGHIYKCDEDDTIQLTSIFHKVFVNGKKIDCPFLMAIVKEESSSHFGRRSLKYSDKITYNDGSKQYSNEDFILAVCATFAMAHNACWFVYAIDIKNQDELHLKIVIVDANSSLEYVDSTHRKSQWLKLIPASEYLNICGDATNTNSNFLDNFSLQIIYYGAPGTGKSYKIKELTKGDDTIIRTTFHPDSDYASFVGCYKPIEVEEERTFVYWNPTSGQPELMKVVNETGDAKLDKEKKITYKFTQQAFLKAYIQAWEKMGKLRHFPTPTLMSVSGTPTSPYARTGKLGNKKDFKYNEHVPAEITPVELTKVEMEELCGVDNFDFPFNNNMDNFGVLHDKITVIVTDKPTDELKNQKLTPIKLSAQKIRELYEKYKELTNLRKSEENSSQLEQLSLILFEIHEKLKKESIEALDGYTGEGVTLRTSYNLLGLYDSSIKTIYLFKENIGDDLWLLCAVYIHEMFHAYYDSKENPAQIEEPIVECNTLCFLELFDEKFKKNYEDSVKKKRNNCSINHYGFGSYLYENRSLDWMSAYMKGKGNVQKNPDFVNEYVEKFLPIYPWGKESEAMNLLYNILIPKVIPDSELQYLVIEEINRGNCAQIFGDVFQLLDRGDEDFSIYPIVPDEDITRELKEVFKNLDLSAVENYINDIFRDNYPNGITDKIKNGELLCLPPNLNLLATMNTSDQSLFPMDSAFKRRWEWIYQGIVEGTKKNDEGKIVPLGWKIALEGYEPIDWWEFIQRINKVISNLTTSEDKQLGYFFCQPDGKDGKTISAKRFVGKVIFYLWNDVFKDYAFDDPCCKDEKEQEVLYAKFYEENGVTPNTKVLAHFFNAKTLDGEKNPLAILLDKPEQPEGQTQAEEPATE